MKKGFLVLLLAMAVAAPVFAQVSPESARAEAYYHFTRGRLLDAEGDWMGAIEEYRQALALDPGNSFIFSEMADTYLRHNRIRDAIGAADQAVAANPDNIEAHRLLSSIYTNMIGEAGPRQPVPVETVDRAIHEFNEIVRIDPNDQTGYLMLGRLYQFKNEPERAAEIYEKLLGVNPASQEGVLSLAALHLESGSNAEAVRILEAFLEDQPDSDRGWIALAQAYENLDQYANAADAYRKALELQPDNLDLKKAAAQASFMADEFDAAAPLFEGVLEVEPDDGVALLRLGQIYHSQQKYPEAREKLSRAVQLYPGNLEVQFHMMMLERDEGQIDAAITRIKSLLDRTRREDGRYSDAERRNRQFFLTHLALMTSSQGRYDETIAAANELKDVAIEDEGQADVLLIESYRSQKNLDKAIAQAQTALQANPDSRQLQMLRADLIAQNGRLDEGVQALRAMMDGTDADLEVVSMLTHVYERDRKYAEAQQVLDEAAQRFPNNEHVHFLQGALYEQQDKFVEAEAAFRKALALESDNAAVLNYLGYMLADRGEKLEEALSMIQKAVDQDPTNGAYLDSLGWVYFRMNQMDLAEKYLKRALQFTSTDPTIHEHIGDLYHKTDRRDLARAAWMRSLELASDPEEIEAVRKKLNDLR